MLNDAMKFLKQIDISGLNQKIRDFRKLNIRNLSEKELADAILNVLSDNGVFVYITQSLVFPRGTKFYRVRELVGSNHPNESLKSEQDFWNPPEQKIKKYGRLNKPGESLLYTSPLNPLIAKLEARVQENLFYAIIVYDSIEEIKSNCIGSEYDYDKLGIDDAHCRLVNDILNDFLREEFIRDVGVGTEYLYKVSELIAKSYFDLPPREIQDAWCYPSLFSKKDNNVCFRPDIAKEKLELRGALIAKNDSINEIHVKCIAHGFDENGIPIIHRLGSEIQKRVFPEVVLSN